MAHHTVGIGILGFGGSAMFMAQQLANLEGAELRCLAGKEPDKAANRAGRPGLPRFRDFDGMLAMPEVDLVYIATPSSLHYEQARKALRAGRHVIVDRPLALTMDHAHEIVGLARDKGLVLTTTAPHRYSPVVAQVKRLIASKVLGEVVHGYFERYSCEAGLAPEHWLGQTNGSIFVEHGVDFFDQVSGLLGRGEIESAGRVLRAGTGGEDQAYCTTRHGHVPFTYYQGFSPSGRPERQEMRLVFERGDVTLHESIPTHALLRTTRDESVLAVLREIFPNARVDVETPPASPERLIRASHSPRVTVTSQPESEASLAQDLLRAMVQDQLAYIADRSHVRAVTEENGREALRLAVLATRLAG